MPSTTKKKSKSIGAYRPKPLGERIPTVKKHLYISEKANEAFMAYCERNKVSQSFAIEEFIFYVMGGANEDN